MKSMCSSVSPRSRNVGSFGFADRDVRANVPSVQREFVRILELARVAVGGTETQHHHRSRRNVYVAKRGGLARQAEVHLGRARCA
jgi:hypothetical protein